MLLFDAVVSIAAASTLRRHIALCVAGEPRDIGRVPKRILAAAADLQQLADLQRQHITVRVFASAHVRSELAHMAARYLRSMNATAMELYDAGPSECVQELNKPHSCQPDKRSCSFLMQFEGIRRSFALMEAYERSQGLRFDYVVRFRFDILCSGWDQLARVIHSPHPTFLGAARSWPSQRLGPLDFSDMAWISSRAAATPLMTAVDEYGTRGCGELMSSSLLRKRCDVLGRPQCTSKRGDLLGCKYFECILLVRLKAALPTTTFLNVAGNQSQRQWVCRKALPDVHSDAAISTRMLQNEY